MHERAALQLFRVARRREAGLHANPGVERRAHDAGPAQLEDVHRHEVGALAPRRDGGGARERVGIDRLGRREADRHARARGPYRGDRRVARTRIQRRGAARVAGMDVHGERAGAGHRDGVARQLGGR